jgi:hypothetical protein
MVDRVYTYDSSRQVSSPCAPWEESFMHREHPLRVALGLLLLTCSACAHQRELTAAERLAIRTVIEHQLEAFRRDDAASAFALASPEIQAKYGTPENFLTIVKTFYEPVYRPRRLGGVTNLYRMDGQLTQPVVLVGPDGDIVVALYTMHKQPDGRWKILGCALIP